MIQVKNIATEKFISPEKIINDLKIAPGMTVAHFGCGTGFFTFPIAKKIGAEAKVYALDILLDKVEAITSQAKLSGLGNIVPKRVNLEKEGGSGLKEKSVDWAVVVNMLHQNEKKNEIIVEAKRILKPNGKILIIDWEKISGAVGPAQEVRISKEEMKKIVETNGLKIEKEFKASNFHYALVVVK